MTLVKRYNSIDNVWEVGYWVSNTTFKIILIERA
jgi:hypothetical protein